MTLNGLYDQIELNCGISACLSHAPHWNQIINCSVNCELTFPAASALLLLWSPPTLPVERRKNYKYFFSKATKTTTTTKKNSNSFYSNSWTKTLFSMYISNIKINILMYEIVCWDSWELSYAVEFFTSWNRPKMLIFTLPISIFITTLSRCIFDKNHATSPTLSHNYSERCFVLIFLKRRTK